MVPKIHAKGSSFKGAAAYLLHDKGRADTSERVAWTETRNLAVDAPDMAWRIMAATAKDQGRLKAEAGVRNTGRKSSKSVLHFTLAWHPDQEPTREDMAAAADQAIAAIGAGDRQALIIAHNDEKQPHVHIMLNRISPENGKMLSSSKEKLNLSKWAEAYEREGGKIYCQERVENNAMRANGEYVRGRPDKPRQMFEMEQPLQAGANDNDRAKVMLDQQRRKDAALALRGRNMSRLHRSAWDRLAEGHRQRKAALARQLQSGINKAKSEIREGFRPQWRKLRQVQESERMTFEELETSFFGRASNMAKAMRLSSEEIGGEKTGIISRTFRILTNAGERKAYFEAAQKRARTALQRQQADRLREAIKSLEDVQRVKLANNRAVFEEKRRELAMHQRAEREALRQDWKTRTKDRAAAIQTIVAKLTERETDTQRKARSGISAERQSMLKQRYARSANLDPATEQDNHRQKGHRQK